MGNLIALFTEMVTTVIGSLIHNWLPLSLAILVAALMTVYIDQQKLRSALLSRTHVSIWGSVAVGAFTPLCACGTMAVVLGMLTTTLPWGPIMAFLTSSPLMSPDGFIMTAGIISVKFAIALTIASIIIGLGSGYITQLIEAKTDFLKNQTRFAKKPQGPAPTCGCAEATPTLEPVQAHGYTAATPVLAAQTCGCSGSAPILTVQPCGCAAATPLPGTINANIFSDFLKKIKWSELTQALFNIGVKQILLYYAIFVAIGFLINSFVPTQFIVTLFSAQQFYAVPLAALIGLPLYINGDSALPLIKALMAGGAGDGAMLAFIITGAGTSAWVVAGLVTFMKERVIALYVLFLLAGGILSGYLYDLFLALGG
jgi:uncharacterized protein